jgi:hypothetical protein
MRSILLALGCVVMATGARGAPPPVDSEDYLIMHPYADWVASQHDRQGYWCCDLADGRPVDAQMRATVDSDGVERVHWVVHVTPEHFPAEIDRWLTVPDETIIRGGNPTGAPILWLLHGNVQCFAPPDGT